MSAEDLPPPTRKPSLRLSLKAAVKKVPKNEETMTTPTLKQTTPTQPTTPHAASNEIETSLLDLQADIVIRENLLNEKEKRLQHLERELHEREALLEAHRKIIARSLKEQSARQVVSSQQLGEEERKALDMLKQELDQQEASLKTARMMLQEREDYIAQCENELIVQSMSLTEREAQIEQREEDHEAKKFLDSKAAQAS